MASQQAETSSNSRKETNSVNSPPNLEDAPAHEDGM